MSVHLTWSKTSQCWPLVSHRSPGWKTCVCTYFLCLMSPNIFYVLYFKGSFYPHNVTWRTTYHLHAKLAYVMHTVKYELKVEEKNPWHLTPEIASKPIPNKFFSTEKEENILFLTFRCIQRAPQRHKYHETIKRAGCTKRPNLLRQCFCESL